MHICPECGQGPQHNDLACRECLNNLKNYLRHPWERKPPPETKEKYVNEKELYIVNQLVTDLVFEALIRDDISSSSTALLSVKEVYGSALKEQLEYGKQLAEEATAKLDKLGVKY